RRDATPPETRFTATPVDGSGTQATFVFAGDDATAGVASFECSLDGTAFAACASPLTVDVAPGAHTFAVRAVDHAGHRDPSAASHAWTVDATPPAVTPSVTGTLGSNGWYVGDVQVSWQVADPDSGVTTTGCNTVVLTSDTPGAGFTCTATSAGGTTARTVTVKRDTTAPVITAAATTPANANGWYRNDVTVAFACSDATSGVVGCPAAQVLGGEGSAIASAPRAITDAAGNQASSNAVTVRIDRTAPTLAPAVSPGTLLLNAATTAAANGTDALSGIATEQCAPLATGSVGSKTASCTVTDAAGNSASADAGYRVVYGFAGFNSPVQNPPVLNVIKAGRSIPFRWRVVDAQGAPVSNLASATVAATAISCPAATENRISSYGGNNGQLQNLGNGYYQLDWAAASSLRNSCRRLDLNLGDGQVRSAQFKFN
ncbi:MAG TPA: PxKF domain-containing protein, partial [Lysobacter sp.]|nr:PxKF domain-containing protein [Lysobacter sp.]